MPVAWIKALAGTAALCALAAAASLQAQTPPVQTPPVQTPPAPVLVPTSPTTTQYDPNKGFPDHNGPFSAMLVVIPEAELKEFDAPSGSTRHLDRVSRAEPGAVLALKFVFLGMMIDWQKNADITYDIQVLQPDGKIYGHSDYKGLMAMHDHVGTPNGVYDNRNPIVKLQFEPQDMPGVYHIKAVLHDRVAQRDIPLQTSVELLAPPPVAAAASSSTAPATDTADDDKAPAKGKAHHRRKHHH